MRLKKLSVFIFVALLLTGALDAQGRQAGVPTDAEVEQLRATIRRLEQTTPPPNYEAQHRHDVAALRLSLRDKLQAQKAALAAYLESIRSALPERVPQIEKDITNKEAEIKAVTDTLLSGLAAPPTTATPGDDHAVDASAGTGTPQDAGGTAGSGQATPGGQGSSGGQGTSGGLAAAAAGVSLLQPAANPQSTAGAIASGGVAAQKQDKLGPCVEVNSPGTNQFSEYERAVCRVVELVRMRKVGTPTSDPDITTSAPRPNATIAIRGLQGFEFQQIIAAKLIGREERGKFLVEAEEARTDKQVEGGPSNSGTTSLVVKGGAPSVLGFAVSNGALVQSQSGTTVTFRGNPIGIIKLLNNKTFDESYFEDEKDPTTRFLKKTSFSVSFNTDRGQTPGVFTADKQQVSAYSVRYEFINERDPRHRSHQEALARFLAEEGVNLTGTIAQTMQALTEVTGAEAGANPLDRAIRFKDPALQSWFQETRALITAAAAGDVEATFKSQLDKFPVDKQLTTETRDIIDHFAEGFSGYLSARNKLLDEIAKGKVITFEYTNNRGVNAPDLSNFRFIAETGIFGGKADLTANASFTIFNSRPAAGTNRVRDFEFSGQLDKPFKVSGVGNFIFSFAGKYERALENVTALDGTVLPNTKGDIAVGQIKLTIPFLDGMKLPISLSFANRTELVREKEVRGNFGFTFDIDKILAKFKPF
ncbi:MAG: hypothetical protein QOH51_3406 [Acidobacteriota bacterium]|jgi:hypothetical protein|nr:hypothetical protein [Acidobacteriota bacterium]